MEVLIVSKTHMSKDACVGGLVLENNRNVRLLDENNHNQPKNTDFNVGDIWDIDFIDRQYIISPHIEDVCVKNKIFIRKIDDIHNFLKVQNIPIWNGSIDNLFEGLLHWTQSGAGFISENGEIPNQSVGFWMSDKELKKRNYNEKIRYNYPYNNGWRNLPYVGFETPLEIIPKGTLIRVSLARWWNQNENTEKRCYLQLSGWYD